jgi:hypothetical protein
MHNWYHSSISSIPYIHRHGLQCTTIHGVSPLFLSPLASSPFLPLCPLLLTWNPPCCDRNRPPRSQVACKLTSLAYPSPKPSPLQIPRTPTVQRLTKKTSGILRLLLSGTYTITWIILKLSSIISFKKITSKKEYTYIHANTCDALLHLEINLLKNILTVKLSLYFVQFKTMK